MHIHSKPSGGGEEIEKHIDSLRKKGYSGMVITNHFFHGDTKIDRNLPWNEFVDAYREDYERGKRVAGYYDFDVLFGIEEHIGGGKEVLIYGITPDFLYRNPQILKLEFSQLCLLVHQNGGLIYQAHPYRDRWYISAPGPVDSLSLVDGIEVYNAGNTPEENQKALLLAKEKGLKCIAGSDGHSLSSAGRSGILSPTRIKTNQELIHILKSGNYKIIEG